MGQLAVSIAVSLLIVFLAYVAARLLGRVAARSVARRGGDRGETLAPIARTIVFIGVFLTGLVMAFDRVGLDISAVLAGAGIIGLAVGFGAQSLVKDCINGFFLILENVLSVGHIVEIDGKTGTVEKVGLRMTHVRLFNGQLWFIQNGNIDKVGSFNHDWVRAVVEVGLPYESDVQQAMATMLEIGKAWADENQELIVAAPEVHGLLGFNSSDVNVRLAVKIRATGLHAATERELRLRIKARFDADGIEIPFPRQVVYHRQEENQSELRVKAG